MRKMKIKEVAEVVSGATPKTNIESYWDGEYPWITPAEINDDTTYIFNTERNLTEQGVQSASLKKLKKGTVLLSSRAPIGKVAIAGIDLYCNQGFKNLVCDEEIVDPKYVYYWLKSKTDYLNALGRGATFKEISKSIVEEIEIPIPKLEVQKKLVQAMDKCKDLIDKRKEQIQACDELIKSQFIEMFGDPRTNPYNWEESSIGDCYYVKGGKRIPKGMGYSDEVTAHPYLRATDMKNATILDNDIKYISDEVYDKIKNYTVSDGDIYLTNVGVNLGMAGVIPKKYDGANLTENAVKLVPKQDKLTGMFISYYINSPGIQEYVNERKMSVGVPKLAIFRIESMPVIIPPLELQNEFAKFVQQVDKLKFEMEKSLHELENNFSALMQKAFSGQLF